MDLISGQWAVFSETFPASGMTRNGELYERQTSEPRTSAPAFSSLPTPGASDGNRGATDPRGITGQVKLADVAVHGLFPTPGAYDASRGGAADPEKRREAGHQVSLADVTEKGLPLLPTPNSWEGQRGAMPTETLRARGHQVTLTSVAAEALLPTHLATRVHYTAFGVYAAAVARWAGIVGRAAPPPTEPTGKNGAHRLSARFVEWMMGLPDGWVTDILKRRVDALKALGNGVVPQQAAYALADMRAEFEAEAADHEQG